ncbi:hypothetical protein ACOME3_007674 [Neoechinorhynchus agilis]
MIFEVLLLSAGILCTLSNITEFKETNDANEMSGIHINDLESTLTYMFQKEIPKLKKVKINTIHRLIQVLLTYCPMRNTTHNQLVYLDDKLANQSASNISGQKFRKYASTKKTERSFSQIQWESCNNSRDEYTNYECGIWTLFHTMSAKLYTANNLTESQYKNETLRIKESIKRYTKHHHSNKEHAKTFLRLLKRCPTTPEDLLVCLYNGKHRRFR